MDSGRRSRSCGCPSGRVSRKTGIVTIVGARACHGRTLQTLLHPPAIGFPPETHYATMPYSPAQYLSLLSCFVTAQRPTTWRYRRASKAAARIRACRTKDACKLKRPRDFWRPQPIEAAYSSPLARAYETAEIVSRSTWAASARIRRFTRSGCWSLGRPELGRDFATRARSPSMPLSMIQQRTVTREAKT